MKTGCTAFRPDRLLSFMEIHRHNILLLLHSVEEGASLVAQMVKNLPAMQLMPRFNPLVGKIPWRRKWQPAPIFLPGEFHG